jgi:hypothetical protein
MENFASQHRYSHIKNTKGIIILRILIQIQNERRSFLASKPVRYKSKLDQERPFVNDPTQVPH